MNSKKYFNYPLFFLAVLLVSASFLFLACLSAPTSLKKYGNTNYYLFHQLRAGLLPAIILGFLAYKISLKYLKKWAPLLVLLNIISLFFVFLPVIGSKYWGASRWISIGSITIQPSEFLKITSILYLSAWIASKLSDVQEKDWKSITKKGYHNIIYVLVPFIVFLGLIAVALYFQKDASTLGIVTITLLVLYFSARTPLWHTLLIVVGGISSLLFMVTFEPYRLDRLKIFLHPGIDPLGKGLQPLQSLISLGSGGVFGKGLGMSAQKFGFLPQAMSDSIFAIIGEEIGAIGCIALVVAFLLFFWLGLQIAKNSNDRFSKMVAVGIIFWITFQAFINIASTAGIFPLAGIPLPFFSYGGSHLVVELIGVGLLLNISKNT
ncbi:MAG: putative peptidoglycan glycosyltransferase FtsW, partial [Candidatus Staskawiczbacteria bacterium]|nr:putative peptidoglycan glycosyltransferase FtsW [Candidatus Staskawiczbacteria bacterium]